MVRAPGRAHLRSGWTSARGTQADPGQSWCCGRRHEACPRVGYTRPGETPSPRGARDGASPCEAGSPEHEQEPARGVKEEGALLKLRGRASVLALGRSTG